MAHDGANRHDQPLLEPTLTSIPIERPAPTAGRPQALSLDRGYDSPRMHDLAVKHGYTPHIRARGEEIKLKARTPGWRPTVGRRGNPLLAEPKPRHPHPLVQERRQPPRAPPTRRRPDRLQESPASPARHNPNGIGP